MLKNNYWKVGKKNDNDVNANVTQHKHNNIKCYALTFSNI